MKEFEITFDYKKDLGVKNIFIENVDVLQEEIGETTKERKIRKMTGKGLFLDVGFKINKGKTLLIYRGSDNDLTEEDLTDDTAPYDFPLGGDKEGEYRSAYLKRSSAVFINSNDEPDFRPVYDKKNNVIELIALRDIKVTEKPRQVFVNYNEGMVNGQYYREIDTTVQKMFTHSGHNSDTPGDRVESVEEDYTVISASHLEQYSDAMKCIQFLFKDKTPDQFILPKLSLTLLEQGEELNETIAGAIRLNDEISIKDDFYNACLFAADEKNNRLKPMDDPQPTVFWMACYMGNKQLMDFLFELDEFDLKQCTISEGSSPFHAAMAGILPITEKIHYYNLFIKKGMYPYHTNYDGERPIDYLMESWINSRDASNEDKKELEKIIKTFNQGLNKKVPEGFSLINKRQSLVVLKEKPKNEPELRNRVILDDEEKKEEEEEGNSEEVISLIEGMVNVKKSLNDAIKTSNSIIIENKELKDLSFKYLKDYKNLMQLKMSGKPVSKEGMSLLITNMNSLVLEINNLKLKEELNLKQITDPIIEENNESIDEESINKLLDMHDHLMNEYQSYKNNEFQLKCKTVFIEMEKHSQLLINICEYFSEPKKALNQVNVLIETYTSLLEILDKSKEKFTDNKDSVVIINKNNEKEVAVGTLFNNNKRKFEELNPNSSNKIHDNGSTHSNNNGFNTSIGS